jgi:nitrogen-specific signal transduction histidine kinase
LCHEYHDPGSADEIGYLLLELGATDLQNIVSGATDEVCEVAQKLEITIEQPDMEKREGPDGVQNSSLKKETDNLGPSSDALSSSALLSEENTAQIELHRKVRDTALLTGVLENISKAGSADEFIGVFEEAVNVLFDFEKLLFMLLDSKGLFLQGRVSEASPYRQLSDGITIPTKGNSSQIVQTYNSAKMSYITKTDKNINLADRQILSVMNCTKILLIPLTADNASVGIILVGIPDHSPRVTTEDYKVLQILARQIAFSLHIERMKAQKAAELQQERMEAISLTARKFAHEVNNPLGIITNYLTSLKLKLTQEENIQSDISIIHEEIERISSMVNQLDLFSQPATQDIHAIDLNEVLKDIVQIVKNSLLNDGDVTIDFEPCRGLPPLLTSRDGIKQIIISEAMEEGGTITIATKHGEKELDSGEQDSVQIIVSDDGPGLPSSVRENIFSPFITTKTGNHSGLGLSIVYKTVQVLGGDIHVTSDGPHGTEFIIVLPLEKT